MAKSTGKDAAKKTDSKKSVSKKSDAKKAHTKMADTKKADVKKADVKKADAKKAASKKADAKKAGSKKTDLKKAAKKGATKKADAKKADAKKAGSKKTDARKAIGKKADSKSGGRTKAAENAKATPTAATPEIPSTLERSPDPKAARTFVAAHDSAVETYGHGERATRTALAAVKHSYEKVGDHWEAKDEKGPSDSQAASPRGRSGTSAGGVDTTATRAHLYLLAQRLDVPGRSRMSKAQLIEALQKANDSASAKARR